MFADICFEREGKPKSAIELKRDPFPNLQRFNGRSEITRITLAETQELHVKNY